MKGLLVILSLLGAVLCRPSTDFVPPGNFSTQPLSPADREWLSQVPLQRTTYPAGFKLVYVSRNGHLVENTRPATGDYLEVVGSPHTPKNVVFVAAGMLSKMLRNGRPSLFNRMARHPGSGLGIFTLEEKVTVFPEAASLRGSPQCAGRCDGSCSHTCTFDGRKFANIGAITIGSRSFSNVDNIMCTACDSNGHKYNTVVHEFAHSVQRIGMTTQEKTQLGMAYRHAKDNQLWRPGSYAMGNSAEYWAESSGAFFLVNLYFSNGGMTDCPGHQCRTEAEVRQFLHDHDPRLWTLLSDVYTRGHPNITSGLTICPQTSG